MATASEKLTAHMSLLQYENEIFLDMYDDNALLVLCEGLGLERIFVNFLRLYCDLPELVFVLNTDQMQQEYYIDQLKLLGIEKLPVVLTSEFSINERKKMYNRGGVFFASSRILVMDLLVDRIPVHLITGLLITKAHKMGDACQEPFIMRLYRQKNKEGFIKAFTDNPSALVGGYGRLERVMKSLFVGKVFLWPRFHSNVSACLDKHKPEVIEIGVELSPSMKAIQSSLLEIVSACLKELKSNNPGLDTDDFTVENSLGKSFDRNIRNQLDPIWNQLGTKTKHLVADLRTLRLLLRALSQYDCCTFLHMLESSSGSEKAFGKNPGWIFLAAADHLFLHARYRVHGNKVKKDKVTASEEPLLEMNPKWEILSEIIKEITEANNATAKTKLGKGKVLVCASDMRSSKLIRDFLQDGGRATMVRSYNRVFNKHISLPKDMPVSSTDQNTLTQMLPKTKKEEDTKFEQSNTAVKNISPKLKEKSTKCAIFESGENEHGNENNYFQIRALSDPETLVHALHGNPDLYSLTRVLNKVEPRYVILHDCSVHFVRQLELYKACRPGVPFRVYFLTFQSSAEEQIYLTSLRREKEAFHSLIQEKSTMVIPKEREGKNEDDPQFNRSVAAAYEVNTRKAGGQQLPEKEQRIIVDMREFRSELPSLLHKRGIEIEPITLEVGDYILTPDICVERKSISDLIGSLTNGRLYSQCVAMTRYYKQAMLLIEFDANKAFSFQARGTAGAKITLKELNQKLTLLLIHFPKLRLSWCTSPSNAAMLFHELKLSRNQPDPVKAGAVGTDENGSGSLGKYNSKPYDFLLQLPGINVKNCQSILHHVKNLKELCELDEDQLTKLLDSKINARLLYEFLHKSYDPTTKSNTKKRPLAKGETSSGASGVSGFARFRKVKK